MMLVGLWRLGVNLLNIFRFYGISVRFIISRFFIILMFLKQQVTDFSPRVPRFISYGSSKSYYNRQLYNPLVRVFANKNYLALFVWGKD